MVAQFVCAVFWFHPMVWLLARRVAEEAELACDDFAINCNYSAVLWTGWR
jgi:beta-lactamase regulating signal transducer with metallopeptidase domain